MNAKKTLFPLVTPGGVAAALFGAHAVKWHWPSEAFERPKLVRRMKQLFAASLLGRGVKLVTAAR
ncbi:MAG TPA: hypothetical protein VME46_13540 [Acidimicrobiales bacterium]|nr:hypothetical protein [Acidimicrobiales bacterium]